ncbi:MAG: DegT/DnrJ/EryC1/StrS family aminotransferase [Sedimentibacter sp.]
MIRLSMPEISSEESEEIKKVLESKNLIQGEKVEQFENLVSEFLNVKHCIAVSSGTAALHLALLALEIKKGDEIIVPDFTFPATANVVELLGATTKLVDIKLDDFCIDTDKIEKVITDKTKVIIPVHEFGQCADMEKINILANKYNLKIIEDAACALGAVYNSKKAGTLGHIGCFSFHPRKAITTGEGGMIVTDDEELVQSFKALRNHGIKYINNKIEFTTAGFNYRMTDIQAAIGIVQMKKLKKIIDTRRNLVKEYEKLLKDEAKLILPKEKKYGSHIYQTYHILLKEEFNRDYIKNKLKEKNVECNIGAYALHEQLYYKEKYKFNMEFFINSSYAYTHGLALPLHCQLSYEDIRLITDNIKFLLSEQ